MMDSKYWLFVSTFLLVSSFVISTPVPDEIVEEADDTRIIGGEKAQSAQFPFIVNLRFTSKNARKFPKRLAQNLITNL